MPQWLIKNQPQGDQELREKRDGQQDGNCEKMNVFTTSQHRPSGRSCRQTPRAQTVGSLRPTSERVATCMNMANPAANCLQRDLPRNLKLRRRATGGLAFWQLSVAQPSVGWSISRDSGMFTRPPRRIISSWCSRASVRIAFAVWSPRRMISRSWRRTMRNKGHFLRLNGYTHANMAVFSRATINRNVPSPPCSFPPPTPYAYRDVSA